MIGILENYQANYKAIIHSEKLSNCRKNALLRNLLSEIDYIFFGACDKEQSIIDQQEEAKNLHTYIQKNLIIC
ncbi:hypothetical protein [Carnobacterium inhibens]|uniref:Uncharacterized protein n=1 Tax=Carnobacterium inhibens subsp. gilichinskyi TaxID=1266845 RepID=U5SCT2_9LACT|nr:hypothetical protein [Carnobacterium inhibens]AGY83045.1 hypothetical protein Q783_12200 [Carnobacterium inhibens subsp. gilichinskyi]